MIIAIIKFIRLKNYINLLKTVLINYLNPNRLDNILICDQTAEFVEVQIIFL